MWALIKLFLESREGDWERYQKDLASTSIRRGQAFYSALSPSDRQLIANTPVRHVLHERPTGSESPN